MPLSKQEQDDWDLTVQMAREAIGAWDADHPETTGDRMYLAVNAELTRLRAIETAAREYILAAHADPCGYERDGQSDARRQAEATAFQKLARLLGVPGYEQQALGGADATH